MHPLRSFVLALAFTIVVGTISDRTTGQPLSGVTVTAGKMHALTHADGVFKLIGVKPGPLSLGVESDDVPPQHFSLTAHGATTRADLRVCSTTLDYNCGPPQ